MDPEIITIIGLCAFLALWYGGGYLYNRRRGQRLFYWLEAGLGILGGNTEAGWMGSPAAGARVNVTHAAPPFRRLEITLLLENREILLLWLLNHLRGKRDWLIIKATLRSPRRGEVEIVPAKGRTAQALHREQEQSWTWQEGPHNLTIAYRGPGAQGQVTGLISWLEVYGEHLHRFSWRKADPHVQWQMKVGGLLTTASETFLADLQSTLVMSDAR
ncbi:MAG: hypothetical protein SWK90_01845 [Chloroflexota bacterium]|nr:hypothetical protein [Chloroflexota bacterium]